MDTATQNITGPYYGQTYRVGTVDGLYEEIPIDPSPRTLPVIGPGNIEVRYMDGTVETIPNISQYLIQKEYVQIALMDSTIVNINSSVVRRFDFKRTV